MSRAFWIIGLLVGCTPLRSVPEQEMGYWRMCARYVSDRCYGSPAGHRECMNQLEQAYADSSPDERVRLLRGQGCPAVQRP